MNNFTVHYEFPNSYEQIRDVNFQELTLHVFDTTGNPSWTMKLKHGQGSIRYKYGGFRSVRLDSLYYLPFNDGSRQYAVVSYTLQGGHGSATVDGLAQVFELASHRLTSIEQLEWDSDFVTSKPYFSFNEKSNTLIVRSGHLLPGDAHCCVSAMDVFTLRWKVDRFIEIGRRTELSDEGIRAGKKL